MTKVTYVPPNEPGYPASMEWNGITFHANIPVDLDPVKHSYMVPIVRKWHDPVANRILSVATEQRMSMAEIARTNPTFQVEGEAPAARRSPGRPRKPVNAEEYRGHAVAWIASADDHDALAERWNDEEALRERCGVGDEDIAYLRPLFDARHHDLKKQAE